MEEKICPLFKEPCRDDCAWRKNLSELSEGGIDAYSVCAVNILVAGALSDVVNLALV